MMSSDPARRWQPPRLTPDAAALAGRLCRRRMPASGAGWSVRVVAPPERIEDAEAHALTLAGAPVKLEMPRGLLLQVLARLDPAAPDAAGEARRLLLELALEDVATALAPTLPVGPPAPGETPLLVGLECRAGAAQWTGRLHLSERAAAALAAALDPLPPAPVLPRVPVALRVRAGACDLPLRELCGVQPGDVLLPDVLPGEGLDEAAGPGAVLLVAEERWAWQGRHQPGGVVVLSPRARLAALGLKGWTMMDDETQPPLDAELNEMPVRLVFEAGRLEVPLGELAQVGPGHVFALPGAAGLVDILANGRRIGQGELVQVGEGAGVRVLRLHGVS